MSNRSIRRDVLAGLGAVLVLGVPARASAEQFTFFNFEYEATLQNTRDAHYDVRPSEQVPFTQPDSWRAPIDYTQGTVYIEQEVITKPSQLDTQVDICFLNTSGGGYGCRSTVFYKTTGRVTTMRPANSFYQFNQINWNGKITFVQLIVKDRNNTNGGNPKASFMPTRMRIAMTFVSQGGTYTPPPGFAAAASDAGVADAGVADAPPPVAEVGALPPPSNRDASLPPPISPPPPTVQPPAQGAATPPPAPSPQPMPPVVTPEAAPATVPAASQSGCSLAPRAAAGGALPLLALLLAAARLRGRRPRP
jgi:hypothetical protein